MANSVWKMDPTHSEIQFKVKHMVVSHVTGSFTKFDAGVESENEDFQGAKIKFSADISSISTGQEARDAHLRSDDFFNAEKFPKLVFESTSFKKVDAEVYVLKGNLKIRDVTMPIELAVEYGGKVKDPYGNYRAGFSLAGKINRKDFDLKWNALLESGNAVVSDEVRLTANFEFVQPA